jgi:hypothetical protein
VLHVFEDVAFASLLNTDGSTSSIGEHMKRAARVLLRDVPAPNTSTQNASTPNTSTPRAAGERSR